MIRLAPSFTSLSNRMMAMRLIVLLFAAAPPILAVVSSTNDETSPSASRIAFGSCNDQDRHNLMWTIIADRKPAAFVWGGDAIYADIEHDIDWLQFPPRFGHVECAGPERVTNLYQKQLRNPAYQQLLRQNISIFGTIDDHDMGCDDADSTFPWKLENSNAFIDFIGEASDSPMAMRAAAGKGIYGVKLFDFDRPIGQQLVPDREAAIDPDVIPIVDNYKHPGLSSYSNKSVAVFVLDVRTNKDPWKDGFFYDQPDINGDFLGEEQWEWFESALQHSNAAVNVIVNGLQVHSEFFPDPNIAESWSSFPSAQQRLYKNLLEVQSPVLISGDVHMTQLSQKECAGRGEYDEPRVRPLIEMTVSGMTHSWGTVLHHPLEMDVDAKHNALSRFQSFLMRSFMNYVHVVSKWTYLVHSDDIGIEDVGASKQGLQFSLEKNFGELEFDWEERTILLHSIGEGGKDLLNMRVSMDELSSGRKSSYLDKDSFKGFKDLDDWVCVPYRGDVSKTRKRIGHAAIVALLFGVALVLFSPIFLALAWSLRRTQRTVRKARRGQRDRFLNDSRLRARSPSMPPLKPLVT